MGFRTDDRSESESREHGGDERPVHMRKGNNGPRGKTMERKAERGALL